MEVRASKRISARRSGFTLVEILAVLAIGLIVAALSLKSFSGILSGGFNQVVSDMSETMEQARAYAMANNTYVYVGFDEVAAGSTATPAPTGNGLVVVAIAASADGSNGFYSSQTWSPNNSSGTFNLVAISKLMKFPNIHLLNLSANTTGTMVRPTPGSQNYYLGTPVGSSGFGFAWPLAAASSSANYNFSNMIRFGPQGDASIINQTTGTAAPVVDYLEVGLEPSHGATVTTTGNVCAIQIDGSTGLVKSYRP